MAINGSSSLEFELKRFLSRCPNLARNPRLSLLLEKGPNLTEEEVVNSVAELFLHPKYTIPLVGCLRPVGLKIVDRVVLLLSLVSNLRSDSEVSAEDDHDKLLEEGGSFIDYYDKSGRGLQLHGLACLAFSRAVDMVPSVLRSVLNYFKFAPPPFERIVHRMPTSDLLTKASTHALNDLRASTHVLNDLRASYRLLLVEPEVFRTLWDWSCFLDFVQKPLDNDPGDDADFLRNVSDIRWCGIQILTIILERSDKAISNCGLAAEEAMMCLLRWQEFSQDLSLEKAGWYHESCEENTVTDICFNQETYVQPCGRSSVISSSKDKNIKRPNCGGMLETWDMPSTENPFVLNSTVEKSFEMVLLAVTQKWPVLLYGPSGAGKTALISKLARDSRSRVLSIHMDEQIDGKTLLGSYVCTERPGEFRWQPGSLTQAVLNGYWVVFENIDKAPSDIQSILLPLLEGAGSFITGHGEAIRVAEDFRLFSTISSSKLDVFYSREGGSSLGALWRRVMIGSSNDKDLQCIVKAWYPDLEPLAGKLIETFKMVNELAGCQLGSSYSSFNRFSLRDLLKWCKRIAGLEFSFGGGALSTNVCKSIYQEAVDIFAASSTRAENRLTTMKDIAKMWAVPSEAGETLYPLNKPIIQELHSGLCVGRATLQCVQTLFHRKRKPFVEIRSSLHVLEKIACSVKFNEPVLLVGETGTGKTTLVQNLAMRLGQKLTVLNLSQQSDVADLLGGFKPMNAQFICIPLYKEFENLFVKTFSIKKNGEFLARLKKLVTDKNWKKLFRGFQEGVQKILEIGKFGSGKKRKRPLDGKLLEAWENFSLKLESAHVQISTSSGMIFSFVEGAFVTALKNGDWILLDEVNLAPPETLQRIIGVLEEESGSLCLAERGDVDYIHRHPSFRIFACMNPATDAGKRDLPFALRGRFTEYFVDEVLDDEDLVLFVNQFLDDSHPKRELVDKIVRFYKSAKKESEERLQDGANQKPQYSLRSLYRALEYTMKAVEYTEKAGRKFDFQKALYDGFCMFFLTLLDKPSSKLMNQQILSCLLGNKVPSHIPFDHYLVVKGDSRSRSFLEKYVLTASIKEHLTNLARAVFIGRYPVLLQGPTSSGKTSLVQYLAAITGHEFVRINNHEHTDLQEYLGSYITDASGKLVYQEGVLVTAVRNGHWIVLDELNLAPSDVLEALNRLLDDNRELFVPELTETVQAHPNFMLFATQNPPTFYGGRKMLSRAFRNRFVEIHVDEIPEAELSTILENRCQIPRSYADKMIEVMKELQLRRQGSKVFAGKHGFITPRDLFRWADRFRTFGKSYEDLARDGYYLLAERLRDNGERDVVQEVLERHLRVKLTKDDLYEKESARRDEVLKLCEYPGVSENLGGIIWTESMWRLYFLVERCYKLREPVLLVGETGGGKTTVCQLLSAILNSRLHILNCHQYTETSDFLGGFYPVRERSTIMSEVKHLCKQLMLSKAFIHYPDDIKISSDIGQISSTIDQLTELIKRYKTGQVSHPEVTLEDLEVFELVKMDLAQLHQKWQTIFMWHDGPLVQAMRSGDVFLVDEISLADDSVLERLNSVLEPERKLSLAEKGGSDLETITAHPNFFLLATMNPGGDYGKKELSPALRNRFTEIWVPPVNDLSELRNIALKRVSDPNLSFVVDPMLKFWEWFNQLQTGRMLTVRDLLSWVAFFNATERSLQPEVSFLHGAFLVLLDGLSLGTSVSKSDAKAWRERCLSFLQQQIELGQSSLRRSSISMESFGWGSHGTSNISDNHDNQSDNCFGIHPFYIEKGDDDLYVEGFEFLAPTTRNNALRVLRAMQLAKPVLLEGSPGVGKTSLIVALGKYSGHTVERINLSEQTDIMDLLGSDLPVESDEGMQFAWSDGILLQALKKGSWILLDELNLAPQSVLEGLNAILDHRAEVFIPELGVTYKCPASFRVFACQNPSYQGGGRKGLPKSFLNRFTKVYVDELVDDDYIFICNSLYPSIPRLILSKLILFNKRLHEDTMLYHKFAQDGSPWEFNLRDVIRSCEIIQGAPEKSKFDCFLNTVYLQRMRTASDRTQVVQLYEQVFGLKPLLIPYPRVQLNPQNLIIGSTCIKRNHFQSSKVSSSNLKILPGMRHSLEAAAECIQHKWMCILIGPPSSGKTSMIRLLAHLSGNVLNELNLSSATDISELLGCFEQYNAFRNYRSAIARVECYVKEYLSFQLEPQTEAFRKRIKDLTTLWLAFLSRVDTYSASAFIDNCSRRVIDSISLLVEIIEHLRLDMEKNAWPLSWSCKDLDTTLTIISKLEEDYQRRPYSVKFEWVTGLLIKALENGEWIVLENANLCNPTVLDRINSLVEPCGSITVNERGTIDGKPMIIQPHPRFRIFLTVNSSYGEVSRAMRNRGVEIFMMDPYWLLENESGSNCDEIELKDVKRFLILAGIPFSKLVDSMARAHVYAKGEGLRFNVHISYLELSRWVQLYHQLLANGNRYLWSPWISWEHTYLSSFVEAEGKDIVASTVRSYFSMDDFYKFESAQSRSLCLPGGWPIALKLRDFIWYSRETCVKQNCMYLEFLGAQSASYTFFVARERCPTEHARSADGFRLTYLIDVKMLQETMFPKISNENISNYGAPSKFDLELCGKKLLFAANWTIEQATERDIELYLCWFDWFGSCLQPFCSFFDSFLTLIKEEIEHPIWNHIIRCRRELMSHHQIDLDLKPVPMLSTELLNLCGSDDQSKSLSNLLCNSINCVGILRRSYHQWGAERDHYNDVKQCFIPVLESIRKVEQDVLKMLVESPSFDVLFQLYSNLLEDHMSLWDCIKSSNLEGLLISWRSIMKDAAKLQEFCPSEIDISLIVSIFIAAVPSWLSHSQKSLLWVHGGHPSLPSSAVLYQKQQQLLNLCELVWPKKTKSWKQVANVHLIEAAVASIPELRLLAMQGVCMSSHIMSNEDDFYIVQQLEEMYQILLKRFEYEKLRLEKCVRSNGEPPVVENTPCCIFSHDILGRSSGFDSWQDTLPMIDSNSLFRDIELLHKLSKMVSLDEEELQLALSNPLSNPTQQNTEALMLDKPLRSLVDFSLNFSSRPPTDFLPHQKILWALDAWREVDSVTTKVASFVLEMWFRWHSSLWRPCSVLFETSGTGICEQHMLLQPVKIATVLKILQSRTSIKDYHLHGLKLRAASHNIWRSFPQMTDLNRFLLTTARALFQQIIFAHRKSFEANSFATIKSLLYTSQENVIKKDDILILISHIASSSHLGLTNLMDLWIEPLLGELYLQHSPREFLYSLGSAWLRIGGLRYHLLISCDDLDPAAKYSFKYSQMMQKIALLEMEAEVRKECNYLAGLYHMGETDKKRISLVENLKLKCSRLRRKVVFRSDPGKFKDLKSECDEFLKLITSSTGLIKNFNSMEAQQITEQVLNWQETATGFIDRLSSEYAAYDDIVQPVQVAIYEMKLGFSLVLSSALQKKFLENVQQDDMERVLETIYSFMRFPRGCASNIVSADINCKSEMVEFPSCGTHFVTNTWTLNMKLLESLFSSKGDVAADEKVSVFQPNAAVHQNILTRIVHFVAEAQLMDKESFMLLDKIFDESARDWINLKVKLKDKAEDEAQQYKFRSRAFNIENIIGIDISTLGSLCASESFSEWQELMAEDDFTEKKESNEENEMLEEELNAMQESNLNKTVYIHNQLFGAMDLVDFTGAIQVSDAELLSSFIDSYALGSEIIKDLVGLLPSTLDAKLMPEHLLRLCLEHDQNFVSSHNSAATYNFYKDSNASVMATMVELVTALQQRILFLLNEWDDHPALQKILDVIEMLLTIPLSTPLAKALSGLQFLLNRVRILQETVQKFPISDQLEPILRLVCSWQKLEFECWPALLDEVQGQYETNAGKLWFPLYSVLQHRLPTDVAEYNQSTIQSLEQFIQTSSCGEFKKRLQLLFAFHSQISLGIVRDLYLSPCQIENVKILYNICGFYIQFLPLVLEHIESNRRKIESELKELLKLHQWERPESYVSIEISKKSRQKLKKLVQKYTDLLQQNVMLILNQEMSESGLKTPSIQDPPLYESKEMLNVSCTQIQYKDKDRSIWFVNWRKKVDLALQNLQLGGSAEFDIPNLPSKDAEGVATIFGECLASQSESFVYWEEWKLLWETVDKICRTAVDCGDLWKEDNKSLRKKRALFDLLKLLENCGLSKRRSTFLEDRLQTNQSNCWLLQPSYDMQHLLTPGRLPSGDVDVAGQSTSQIFPYESWVTDWKNANHCYFKGIASVHVLRQICLKFHKDFSLDQVSRSYSFIDHLIGIQQEQRAAAYSFTEHMRCLRKCLLPLEHIFGSSGALNGVTAEDSFLTQNQYVTYKCMWQQKQLFDGMCSLVREVCLLLKTVESNHLNTCQSVKSEASTVRIFLQKFAPDFHRSKDSLDNYLFGLNRMGSKMVAEYHLCIVSKQMEQLVSQNFQLIERFQDQIKSFCREDVDTNSVEKALLAHFQDIFEKGNRVAEEYSLACQGRNESENLPTIAELETGFGEALKITYKHILDTFERIGTFKSRAFSEELLGSVTVWKVLFESCAADLQLERICKELFKTISIAIKLVNYYGKGHPGLIVQVGAHLKHLHSLLELILTFGNELLHEFLAMHTKVAILTDELANIFASLYSKGFGISKESQEDTNPPDNMTQEASGTGMGEGAGMNDVSDQITDEDQLLGTSEKPSEDQQDGVNEAPSKNDKGIEMQEDFAADTYSVSEDSGDDDDEDGEDEQLDSAMGETGPEGEAVDEKLWDKDHDENPENTNEKYETGSSVKDTDSTSRELRAKEDAASGADESGELDLDKFDKQTDNDNDEDQDNQVDPDASDEHVEDMNMDKEEAFADPTGLNIDDPNQVSEDVDMDEKEGEDPMEDDAPEDNDESGQNNNETEENTSLVEDETLEKIEPEQAAGNSERDDDMGNNEEENLGTDSSVAPEKDVLEPKTSDEFSDQAPNADSATQPRGNSHASDVRDVAASEAKWSNNSCVQNSVAPMSGSHNASEVEIALADSSSGGKLSDDQPKDQLPQHDSSAAPQKIQPNPCRNVGDALEEWKERVKVSVDLQDNNNAEAPDDDMVDDENAEDYGFTSEFEKGTSQALGPATSEQIDNNLNGNKCAADDKDASRQEDITEMDEKQDSQILPLRSGALHLRKEIEDQMEIDGDLEQPVEESPEVDGQIDDHNRESLSSGLVSMKRYHPSEDIHLLDKLSLNDSELGKAQNIEEEFGDMKDDATTLWRKYELRTTSLSQELAEQLRLVMEPTLASKLQGDYKTGKRINMKKVIAYIASQYRKDKIWLRRTRPNKRDYQVVIAVDDSRSMSETGCGDFAIEALVTVCRAMSQLEVGSLAVTSFGKEGNIKLLHDFDRPFTGEAGVKMISSLTFKQENTIADRPMSDLLVYLKNMLDAAMENARRTSGQNPLQQLVLIIADGRFSEKGTLKRYVRDMLSSKRMVAFLLLDGGEDSITDFKEYTFVGKECKTSNYLDTFPFPYYILLRDIEALPRTLADLLRQWFELMNASQD